ncbi:MAG: hypothetical protein CVU19_11280 [Betaproteobacteria bacterium HGW-Betaproteobacteria-13]|jgi:hypothetical protein|nr:MAG: hypothetical protein CVU19_11280 [Betaproteobacteria bacterium HGW-Betaproteobacteria-13]
MPLIPQVQDAALAGDASRRRASICLLLSLLATPASTWLFLNLDMIWPQIMQLEGGAFMLGATVLGTVLALTPLVAGVGFLLAVWYGVESVYLPRQHPSPLIDKVIVAGGLLVWFAPALAAAASIVMGLVQGRVHFTRPPRDYFLATDPIAFWEGIGFWLIMGTLFGLLAWRYWRNKLLKKEAV